VADTGEDDGKGKTPKDGIFCVFYLGHTVKNRMTVTWKQVGSYRVDTEYVCIIRQRPMRWRFL